MNDLLYVPPKSRQENSYLWAFLQRIHEKFGLPDLTFHALHAWSVAHPQDFWQAVWDEGQFVLHAPPRQVMGEVRMPGTTWFEGARLNFAENLLKHRGPEPAVIFANEAGARQTLSRDALRQEVGRVQRGLSDLGVGVGDRVVGYLPNMAESIVAMLAATSLGAIWSSCSPDFGFKGVLDRFGQIDPKVLFFADQYVYGGKWHSMIDKVKEVRQALPSLKASIRVRYPGGKLDEADDSLEFSAIGTAGEPQYEALPFDHPLYIMYSSGTTGKPKCIVHGAGGTLLAHTKEHRLHGDLKEGDTLFYYTTCGWMMWNWLVSGLREGATVVAYEGQPLFPRPKALFNLIDELGITHFGTSPKYLTSIRKLRYVPNKHSDLSSLRTIYSTGAPLLPEHYRFVYESVKKDVQLASICGGTDIIGCFLLGNPLSPVRCGEIQGLGLGLDVRSLNDKGEAVLNEKGELVCANVFPNMPVSFWKDEDGSRYHKAYFEKVEGMWTHGDYIEITSEGGVIVYGRSDATLNPGGVRIGTAEIYRIVEQFDFVSDSIVVGVPKDGDVEVCLFVVTTEELTTERIQEIKKALKTQASPRHVPAHMYRVEGIPRTLSGKKVEKAVLKILQGQDIDNRDAIANPEALEGFAALVF